MNPDEIKNQVNELMELVGFISSEKTNAEIMINKYNKKIQDIHKIISTIREHCHHTYIGKKSTIMGRGTCQICGDSDY